MANWRSFIGLPHILAADPAEGKGADCLLVAFAVLDELRLPHPAVDDNWFQLAANGCWRELEDIWHSVTRPTIDPEDGAVTLIRNGPLGLGVAIVIDQGLLIVHHRKGVVWVPLRLLNKPFKYRRFLG